VSLVTNPTGSTVHGRQWFGPFGQRLALDGTDAPPETTTVIRGFTEHRQEDALGLIDMRGRFYDPLLRQFLTPDPLQADPLSSQGTNPYSYVMNRPPNAWDPSGFDEEDWIPVDSDETGTRHYRYQAYEGEQYVTALERSTAGVSGRRDGEILLAQAVTPGEMTVMSDTSPSVGGDTGPIAQLSLALERMSEDAMRDVARGAAREFGRNGLLMALTGAAFALVQSIPIVDLIADGVLLYLLYDQVVENWGYLTGLAQRFIDGNTTQADREMFGMFVAQMLAVWAGGRAGGRALVGLGIGGGTLGAAGVVLRRLGRRRSGQIRVSHALRTVTATLEERAETWARTTPEALRATQGCEVVAAAIRARIGGELATIRPPVDATFLGAVWNGTRFVGVHWWEHTVVVLEGMVYDEITGPRGLPIEAYRALWQERDILRFGF
jgi:RHS repeat-associated protein